MTTLTAYTRYPEAFDEARWIWRSTSSSTTWCSREKRCANRRFPPVWRPFSAQGSLLGIKPLRDNNGRKTLSRVSKLGLILAAIGLSLPAAAQDYPSRNVKIVVPFGAGGPADVYARFVGQQLSEALKRPFIIENRPGRAPSSAPTRWSRRLPTATRS